ncbi:MAG TPA: nucleotidyltransferase family protein [Pyrinomonadaceae bacterium]|nr:nucleotidyltransferase family protein [Pyrinomonadaceae bacterium]
MNILSEEKRSKIAELCRRNHVRELSIFGSRSRGDAHPGSDFDLLVDFYPDSGISLFEFSRMQIDLQDLLGVHVDLVPKQGLKRLIRDIVLAEAQLIYAA